MQVLHTMRCICNEARPTVTEAVFAFRQKKVLIPGFVQGAII